MYLFIHIRSLIPTYIQFDTGKKGQYVWTQGRDEEALSMGVYNTYTSKNLRYSQVSDQDSWLHKIELLTQKLITNK